MQKDMTLPPYYAELGHAIPSGLSLSLENKVKGCVKNALIALGVNHGSVNMDLLINSKGQVHIVGIGARMGGYSCLLWSLSDGCSIVILFLF